MNVAKIISLIASIFYLVHLALLLYVSSRIQKLYDEPGINYDPGVPLVIVNLVGLVWVIANFGYFYYLSKKEKQGIKIKNSVLFSIIIAVIPLVIYHLLSALGWDLTVYYIS